MYEQRVDLSVPDSSGSTVDTTKVESVTNVELVAEMGDLGALRGVTEAAADLSECTCPEPCERDHANE
jgi:hypothetical protein